MIGQTLSHFRILSEISRGGMGIVYRGLDLNLDREVALKVLPPELVADPERRRRFIQEAKAAAKLDHPHIGMVFEIDEAEGVTFIVMELIQGEKLKDILERERISLARSLELAIEVAEGLASAHDKGIVHRDLKPANIMVTEEGHAKIIDFGLAKLVEPLGGVDSEAETALKGETDPGKVMGTVSYMSPEQARGQNVDHRSDIFSFGIVLHEMLTGEAPFTGPSGADTLNAILSKPSPRLPDLGSEVSEELRFELQHIADKCLAKVRDDRYQGAKELVVDLRSARRHLGSGPVAPAVSTPIRKRWLFVGAAIAAMFLLVAIVFLILQPSRRLVPPSSAEEPSIAVLLFDNNSGDPSLDWLRTALADMLITDLSQSPQIRVLGTDRLYQILREMNRLDERTTSFDVVQEVAEQGNAGTVLLGSFVKAGEKIRISVKIQDAQSGDIVTTEKVEGIGEDSIFQMVDDLTRRVKARFEISEEAESGLDFAIKDVTTSSTEAFRYYAEGTNIGRRGNWSEGILLLEKAVELDPHFATALGRLSAYHSNLILSRIDSGRYLETTSLMPSSSKDTPTKL
jgi:serine/threonine protein kinase